MKTSLIIVAVAIIIILIIGGFFLYYGKTFSNEQVKEDTNSNQQLQVGSIDRIPDSEFQDLETSDDIFNEIDSTLEFLE
ncbi:MAG: hypothetical protein QW727_02565 [Candidatus Pacearchaeota archaeon]